MSMTRQEAKKLATSGVFKKTNFELLMKADYYSFVDQIFDEHEVQLKAKDEEIESLKETLQSKFIRDLDGNATLKATLKRMASK